MPDFPTNILLLGILFPSLQSSFLEVPFTKISIYLLLANYQFNIPVVGHSDRLPASGPLICEVPPSKALFSYTQPTMPHVTGLELITDRIPSLLREEHGTKSSSIHKLGFRQTMGDWSHFEREARLHFSSVTWNGTVLDYNPDQHEYSEYHVKNEQLVCGDEHSVVARFGQNVGHIMTSVIRSCVPLDVHFSDYKAGKTRVQYKKVPDIVVIDSGCTIKMVREAKTPWKHHIQTQIQSPPENFRRYLGKNYLFT